ncbi:MAG: iron-containing alcohol dehydrogenase [Dehalococcoidia bacterium]|nr:MAG: iron-containing alcohol dehydrogenase [Dehalococcoidia bacterium]
MRQCESPPRIDLARGLYYHLLAVCRFQGGTDMATTIFHNPIKLVFGEGTVDKVGEEAALLGKHALVVIGGSRAKKTGLLDKVLADLKAHGIATTVFDGVTPNPRSSTIDEGARVAVKNNVDLIIGVGGGSVMDASKAIRLAY